MRTQSRHSGFTLTELLVVVAVLSVLVVATSAVFIISQQASNVTLQRLELQELVRAAYTTLKRDIVLSYAAQSRGERFTFFGTPVGFTTIGITGSQDAIFRANQAYGIGVDPFFQDGDLTTNFTPEGNLGRITWAVYVGGYDTIDQRTGTLQAGTGQYTSIDSEPVVTYSLVRYVEPGRDDLDTFVVYDTDGVPIRDFWPSTDAILANDTSNRPAQSDRPLDFNLWQELRSAVEYPLMNKDGMSVASDNLTSQVDPTLLRDLVNAKKREVWVRMIAGDPTLPRFWRDNTIPGDLRPDVRDYTLVDNVQSPGFNLHDVNRNQCTLPSGDPVFLRPIDEVAGSTLDSRFRGITPFKRLLPMIDMYDGDNPLNCGNLTGNNGDGIDDMNGFVLDRPSIFNYLILMKNNDGSPRYSSSAGSAIPVSVAQTLRDGMRFEVMQDIPALNGVSFFNYSYMGANPGVFNNSAYWGSSANLGSPGAVTRLEELSRLIEDAARHQDITPQAFVALDEAFRSVSAILSRLKTGSPSAPRMPEAITMNLPISLESAYLGAPDVSRTYSQMIPVPTGYSRPALADAT